MGESNLKNTHFIHNLINYQSRGINGLYQVAGQHKSHCWLEVTYLNHVTLRNICGLHYFAKKINSI